MWCSDLVHLLLYHKWSLMVNPGLWDAGCPEFTDSNFFFPSFSPTLGCKTQPNTGHFQTLQNLPLTHHLFQRIKLNLPTWLLYMMILSDTISMNSLLHTFSGFIPGNDNTLLWFFDYLQNVPVKSWTMFQPKQD